MALKRSIKWETKDQRRIIHYVRLTKRDGEDINRFHLSRLNNTSVFSFTKRDNLKSITEVYNCIEYVLRYKLERKNVIYMSNRVKRTYNLLYKIQI
jgi:hypothetical protein